ncbi:uncharacterized protein LOC117175425 [Belonocnema kinseyi]|uniref:uncharacterized protein LOC117175425 n=1 Tax=Belonocnema kinseyi TaxID=2817044 RepID=UPI00143DCE6C|nr:uncharacterized protein LOC117175425 [Belonocnema kinseyi]
MKCSIFFLLALCAFQTVLADEIPHYEEKLIQAKHKSINELYEVVKGLDDDIWKEVDDIEQEGVRSDEIVYNCGFEGDEHKKFYKNYDAKRYQCHQCYTKVKEAKNIKDIQGAKKCCDKVLTALKKQANLLRDKIIKCVKKCAQLGGDCKKMIKNQGAAFTKTPGAISSKSD